MLKIIADENICELQKYFAKFSNIIAKPGRNITNDDLINADILLVRSVTKVNANLLQNSKVQFVGSFTSGIDHVDTKYLQQNNIKFFGAQGSNALAVVEYVLAAINFFTSKENINLNNCCVGIIGVGNIGLRLYYTLYKLGINTLITDPFFPSYNNIALNLNYIPLEKLLQKADIISLHCPLTTTMPYPTYHLLNSGNFSLLKQNACIINSSRGSVIDDKSLVKYLSTSNKSLNLVFDVWENEPNICDDLLDLCLLATPHIAGYSYDGKLRATKIIYHKLQQYLQKDNNIIDNTNDQLFWKSFTANKLKDNKLLLAALNGISNCYSIYKDSQDMKHAFDNVNQINQKQEIFDNLRKKYYKRYEFGILDFIKNQ